MSNFAFGTVVARVIGIRATVAAEQLVSVDITVTVTGGTTFGSLGVPTLGSVGLSLMSIVIPNSFYTGSFWRRFPVVWRTKCFTNQMMPGRFGPLSVRLHGYTV